MFPQTKIVANTGQPTLVAQLRQTFAATGSEAGSRAAIRAFLASIVESTDDGIVGSDLTGKIISWNSGAQRLFGYTREEALGQHVTFLLPEEQKATFFEVLDAADRGEHIQRYEAVRLTKSKKSVAVTVTLSPVLNDSGKLIGISGIYRDITRRKILEAELVRHKEEAEAANRAKSSFLASMSHEIRTPMNGILGMSEILLDSNLDEEQREYLSIIKNSAESLLAIVNDILDSSKIEANRLDIARTEMRPADLIAAVVREMGIAAKSKALSLSGSVNPATPEVILGDPVRLRQILVNLVGNAIKFTDAGKVEVAVAPALEPSTLLFSVRDSGPGIPAEKKDLVFESFTQLGSPTARQAAGTGLGLTISARLVGLMAGKIWVESDGHSGSTFHFTLPV